MGDVFAIAEKASSVVHRADQRRRLREALDELGSKCGSCRHWITNQCPREGNLNGRKFGPSAWDAKCRVFTEAHWVPEKRERYQAELATLGDAIAGDLTEETKNG